jgi:glycosyltransferase involved in cell wall biosynthesis
MGDNQLPKVSVIIPCYNLGEFIEEAVQSVLSQTYSDYEIIIVNDGSTDENTNKLLEQANWPKTVIYKTINQGLPAARNYGIERASGEYICCLDADDKYHPRFLEKTVVILNNDKEMKYGIVTSHFQLFGETDGVVKVADYNPFSLAVENQLHVASLFRKKAWKDVGGYATNLDGYQDWNFWLAIVSRGYQWYVVQDVLFYYRDRKDSMLKSSDLKREELVIGIFNNNKQFYLNNSENIIKNFIKYVSARQYYIKELTNAKDWHVTLNKQIINSIEYKIINRFKLLARRFRLLKFILKLIYKIIAKLYRLIRACYHFVRHFFLEINELVIRIKKLFFAKSITNEQWPDNLPLISVVIPCFNYGQYIEAAIDSVLNQTFCNFEIIVVDGGSTDNTTVETLRNMKKKNTKIYFRNERYLVGSNRNYGIDKACGKYICCLDADDMIEATYLEKAIFILEKYAYDVVYPSAQCFGSSDFLWLTEKTSFHNIITKGNNVATVAVFRKDAWKAVGGYKDWPIGEGHVPEDWDFWTRLLGYGYRFKALKEPLMFYRVHKNGLTAKAKTKINEQIEVINKENAFLMDKKYVKIRNKRQKLVYKVKDPFINLHMKKYRKRILLVVPFMIIGGADTILFQVFNYLKTDYEFIIITTSEAPAECGDTTDLFQKITKEIYHLKKFLDVHEMSDFIDYVITAKSIDLLFIVGSELIYRFLPLIKRKHPFLKVVDQLFNEYGHIENNRKYAKHIDLNIVTSNKLKNILVERYKEDSNKVFTIVHGVDTKNDYNPDLFAKNTNVIHKKDLVVSYFGRLSDEKNPIMIIEIAKRLKKHDICFNIVGNGPLYYKIKDKIEANELHDKIHMPGFVESIKQTLYESDIVIITSKIEGIPIIVLEALSFGKVVISSDVGGIPAIIKNGYNGYLCNHKHPDDFVNKILLLYRDRKKLEDMSANARSYAVDKLDAVKMKEQYKYTIDMLIQGDSK